MCEHCLAPDTSSGAGIGCDNMTVLIVALLNGRTKEQWYEWVTDRVKKNYGYQTPRNLPQIYAQSRLMAFKARREAQEERDRMRTDRDDSPNNLLTGNLNTFGGLARVLGSTGGISFHPGSGILSGTGNLMFADSSDEEDSGDEMETGSEGGRSFFSDTLGIGGPRSPDATENLKAKLEEFEKGLNDNDLDTMDGPSANEGMSLILFPVLGIRPY